MGAISEPFGSKSRSFCLLSWREREKNLVLQVTEENIKYLFDLHMGRIVSIMLGRTHAFKNI